MAAAAERGLIMEQVAYWSGMTMEAAALTRTALMGTVRMVGNGIANEIDPPAMTTGDATSSSDPVLALPLTLEAAVERLRGSKAARQALGDDFVDHFVRTRDWECREYRKAVTDWELRRYFESV